MAVDLEAIRKRVAELNGQRKYSSVQYWKPEVGEFRVRGLPWKSTPDGMPLREVRFYYIGNNRRFPAPSQFGKPDPINDLLRKLYSTGSPDDRVLAKKLQPKMQAYLPIIVRGQESQGVMVWSLNKFRYQRVLSFFTDSEVGDILDPLEGFDLKVIIKPSGKKFEGRDIMDTIIDPARRTSKLSDDPEQAKKWLESVPNLDDALQHKSPQEIEGLLNAWLAGDAADQSDGTEKGNKAPDAVEQLANDIKGGQPASKPAEAPKAEAKKATKTAAKKAEADIDAEPAKKTTTLDEAFDELMSDDE